MLNLNSLGFDDLDGVVIVDGLHIGCLADRRYAGNNRIEVIGITPAGFILIGVVKIDHNSESAELIDYCFDNTGSLNYFEVADKSDEEIACYVASILA